ncbi:MAG: OB-fold domain-containing protein [Aigarchaeota archaeon]|nr:OB-fold domain-containing protein [Aigarchaeota archaeon]MDW8092499.1 OB-fold domain-containing protein [Nitrososphaerota archaeon]
MRVRPPHHWREREFRYRLTLYKCNRCGTAHHSVRLVCRKCRSTDLRREDAPSIGKLVDSTLLKSCPEGFESRSPYVVGLVEFEDGTRVLSQMTDCDPSELYPNREVEKVVRRLIEDATDGIIVYNYKFRPRLF